MASPPFAIAISSLGGRAATTMAVTTGETRNEIQKNEPKDRCFLSAARPISHETRIPPRIMRLAVACETVESDLIAEEFCTEMKPVA